MNSFTPAHRKQRSEARRLASEKYPLVKVPYLWGEGTNVEHWINQYKYHPLYRGEYLKQLKIIRAKRFKIGGESPAAILAAASLAEKNEGC